MNILTDVHLIFPTFKKNIQLLINNILGLELVDVSVICFDTVMQQSGMAAFVSTATQKNNEGIWLYTTALQRALRPPYFGVY